MAVTMTMPIGEAARRSPELLAVFDRFGLDYCCHGGDTIEQACARVGVDPALVLAGGGDDGGQREPERNWQGATLTELCDDIEATHHVFARDVFVQLGNLLPRVVDAHGGAHPELRALGEVVAGLKEEMIDHLVREERVLFPWLRRLERPESVHVGPPWSVKRPIDCMVHDHDAVAVAFAKVKELTSGYTPPRGACGSVVSLYATLRDLEKDTRRHIHKENNILFPAGLRAEKDRGRRDPAGGCGVHGSSMQE